MEEEEYPGQDCDEGESRAESSAERAWDARQEIAAEQPDVLEEDVIETTQLDITPSNEGMATMLFEIATNSTKGKDREWARMHLIRHYNPKKS